MSQSLYKKLGKTTSLSIYAVVLMFISCAGKASTFLECTSKDIKTCVKEVSKGEVVKGLATKNGKKYIKLDFQIFNDEKGTLKNDKD